MIILSNSIPKTGSTHLANLQEDILNQSKVRNGQQLLRDTHKGRYIANSSNRVLLNLYKINLLKGSVIVKCHWGFKKELDFFCSVSNTKMTMTYRDPRDMILSMIDHGNKTRKGLDPSGAFSDCYNVIDLIPRTLKMLETLEEWQSKKYVHCIKYEDLMFDKYNVLKTMVEFMHLKVEDDNLKKIIQAHENAKNKTHNFNKGTTARWKEEMSKAEKEACLKAFEPFLRKLDYELI